jgi:hypothetical protein
MKIAGNGTGVLLLPPIRKMRIGGGGGRAVPAVALAARDATQIML